MRRNGKMVRNIGLIMYGAMIIVFLIVYLSVNNTSSKLVGEIITNQMTDAVESRAALIEEYVVSAEQHLVAYAQSDEVRNLLLNPDNKTIQTRTQEYTVDFANTKNVFEGLYISNYDCNILAHNDGKSIGIKTREGDALKHLQDNILSKRELTNTGIMKSPSSGEMIISMYYPVYDGDTCLGYAGAAVYANHLMDSLLELDIKGLPDSKYVFLDVNNALYLYNENEELINTPVVDEGYLHVIEQIKENPELTVGAYVHDHKGNEKEHEHEAAKDDAHKDTVKTEEHSESTYIVYKNIPERNWVFMVEDTEKNVYSGIERISNATRNMSIIGPFVLLIVMAIVLLNLSNKLYSVQKAINKVGKMDLTDSKSIRKFVGKKDEVGDICTALDKTVKNLRVYITDIDEQLTAMSEGDFTRKSDVKYVGAFETIQKSLQTIQKSLRRSFSEMYSVTEQLGMGSQNVAEGAANLADAANREKTIAYDINTRISDINEKVAFSTENAIEAKKMTTNAAEVVSRSKDKMDDLIVAMKNIDTVANQIVEINSNLERIAKQTHLLALNASVEATRAGEAGKGFSVVANEIRDLAEKSNDAAAKASMLIEQTIEAVTEGKELADETASCLYEVANETMIIDTSVSEIAEAAIVQKENLDGISSRLREVGETIEVTSSTSEQSASASLELDTQIRVLHKNLKKYKI